MFAAKGTSAIPEMSAHLELMPLFLDLTQRTLAIEMDWASRNAPWAYEAISSSTAIKMIENHQKGKNFHRQTLH
jgi:hypothetical protein